MLKIIEIIKESINRIDFLLEDEKFNEALVGFHEIEMFIESNISKMMEMDLDEKNIISEFYAKYSYVFFSLTEYNVFFEKYIIAQKYGYDVNKIKQFVYNSFIEPNIEEFRFNFNSNIEMIKKYGYIDVECSFEELSYWMLPTGSSNQYYIYSKKDNNIENKIDISNFNEGLVDETNRMDNLFVSNGEIPDFINVIKDIKLFKNNYYIITSQISKLISLFQLEVLNKEVLTKLFIFEKIEDFEIYMNGSGRYLPQNIICNFFDKTKYMTTIEKIHYNRIKNLNVNEKQAILSVCIPSYNRGKRAYENINHLLKSKFDYEIEFILSNNGTENYSKKYYKEISEINDSRLTYFEFEKNQGVALNFCKTIELSKGKYILLLSDEDLVDLDSLEKLINILKYNEYEFGIIKLKANKVTLIPQIEVVEKGKIALDKFMLTSNYMSGNIYNRKILIKYNLIDYIRDNLENHSCFYYPHMVWELFLCQNNDVMELDLNLIQEGKPEDTNLDVVEINDSGFKIPYYASIHGRLNQHSGFYKVIRDLKIIDNDDVLLRTLYKKLCNKTVFLIVLSLKSYYKSTKDLDILINDTYNHLIKYLGYIHQSKISNEYKSDLDYINIIMGGIINEKK